MKTPDSHQASSGVHGEQLFLIEPPSFSPTYPNPSTLAGQALARMLKGERLTQPRFGLTHWRLAAYINELKNMGWPINAIDVARPEGWGIGKPIAEYWLPQWVLSALSDNGSNS